MFRTVLATFALLAASPSPGSVAEVEASIGEIEIIRGGKPLGSARPGTPLVRTDKVRVPVGGAAFVRVLKNDQVVRLEEDLELFVSELAALEAPKAALSAADQVSALLTPRERAAAGQQRLAGFVVRPLAANVVAPEAKKPPRPGTGSSRAAATGGPPSAGGAAARARDEAGPPGAPAAPAAADAVAARPPAPSVVAPPAERANVAGSARAGAARTGRLQLPPEVAACLRAAVKAQPAAVVKRLKGQLTVRVRNGTDGVRVFLEGALPVPACFQAWADEAVPARAATGWEKVEVPL